MELPKVACNLCGRQLDITLHPTRKIPWLLSGFALTRWAEGPRFERNPKRSSEHICQNCLNRIETALREPIADEDDGPVPAEELPTLLDMCGALKGKAPATPPD